MAAPGDCYGGTIAAPQSSAQTRAIVDSMTRTITVSQQMAQELAEVKIGMAHIRTDLTEVKSEMATGKDIDAAVATLRADMYRALWAQGLGLGTLILGLAVVVATVAVF